MTGAETGDTATTRLGSGVAVLRTLSALIGDE